MEHLAEWRATRQFTGTLPYPQKVSALHSQADGGALDRLADRHAGLAQQSGFMDMKSLYMHSWELPAGPRENLSMELGGAMCIIVFTASYWLSTCIFILLDLFLQAGTTLPLL